MVRFSNSTKINWSKNIGKTIRVKVDDNVENLLIVGKNNSKIILKYQNIDYPIHMSSVLQENFSMIFNRLTVTHPEYIKYFLNGISDAKQSSINSTKKFYMVCQDCGRIKKYDMHHFTRSGYLPCECRRSNMSYPERCMFNVLEQIGVEFVREHRFDWMTFKDQDGNKTYGRCDFVLPNYKIIIEMDGSFHYKKVLIGRTLSETIYADKMKDILAEENGYITIRIPSEISKVEYLKEKILQSKLANILNFGNVDWNKVLMFCQSNVAKEICEYKNKHENSTTSDIAKYFQMGIDTVRKILVDGNELGWCIYNKDFEEKLRRNKVQQVLRERNTNNLQPIYQYSIEGKYVQGYRSLTEATRTIGVSTSSLSAALKNQTLCKGYQWSKNKFDNIGVYENKKAK